jgi:hypothetical protein
VRFFATLRMTEFCGECVSPTESTKWLTDHKLKVQDVLSKVKES